MPGTLEETFLQSSLFSFRSMKDIGQKALQQCNETDLVWSPGPETNSIATIVQHLHGNMLSRWTNFPEEDGEKPWRTRDAEFEPSPNITKEEVLSLWESGWKCAFEAIEPLRPERLLQDTTIRGQKLTVLDAIQRQIAHYSYHIGQLVALAKTRKKEEWQTLSVVKGQSKAYKPEGERFVK